MTYWHYTCSHAHLEIGRQGWLVTAAELVPREVPWQGHLVWLTDLRWPNREALGLTMNLTTCDRTAYRYQVTDVSSVEPWTKVARRLPRHMREDLELAPGAMPRHWYVSVGPVPVVLDT